MSIQHFRVVALIPFFLRHFAFLFLLTQKRW